MQCTRAQSVLGNSRGTAAVEFALILLPLLLLIGGATDFGLAYFVSHIVQNAAREGARLAVTLQDLGANDSRVLPVVQSRIPDIGLFAAFKDGITNTGINCASGKEEDKAVTVTVKGLYHYTFLRILPGFINVSMDRAVKMRYEVCP